MAAATDTGPRVDTGSRLIHLALAVGGIGAVATGELAEDAGFGASLHTWLGITLAAALALRILWGVIGPLHARFSYWVPYSTARLKLAGEDLLGLLALKLPRRPAHQGLAGLVQSFGLAVFAWMALTGLPLYFFGAPGEDEGGVIGVLEELHEAGEGLAWAYLALHVGAVVVHSLAGHDEWQDMFFMRRQQNAGER
ncbi:MAG: cytochrome b/b6 domain-containing protein [Betaproteobacteria bacterium]|nr:cytochrome b/b6 domain-containing protein [Betaproteobacteria bacterium]